VNLLEPLPYEAPEPPSSDDIEVIEEQIIEEMLPMDVPIIENSSESELLSKEIKKEALLKKAIQKKKESTDEDTQQSLF